MARHLLASQYEDRGRVIQFHPTTSYETFVGGLAPDEGTRALVPLSKLPRRIAGLLGPGLAAVQHPRDPLLIDAGRQADIFFHEIPLYE